MDTVLKYKLNKFLPYSQIFMKQIVVIALLIVFTLSTVVPRVTPVKSHVPRTYKVSLDDPPLKRWENIVKDYEEPLKRFMQYVDLLPIPQKFYDGVEWYAKNVFEHQDFVKEVDAIAQISGFPFDKIFFLNFMYEFSTFNACTGLLIRNSAGKVLHGRNLDFEMWQILSKLVVNVQYYQGAKRMFSVDTVVGSVFALTGIRHGAFAINVDTRKAKHFYNDLISVMVDNAIPTVWLLRRTLEQQTTYEQATKRLKETRIGGPVYYVVSGVGPNEGMVIERDTDSVHAFYELNNQTWFLVQTNSDRDVPDPVIDPRRVPVEMRLRERGNIHFEQQQLLDDFMFQWPTFNIATIMTAIMIPESGYHNTTVWYGYNPSPPPSGEQLLE